jgi:hypothetical protein
MRREQPALPPSGGARILGNWQNKAKAKYKRQNEFGSSFCLLPFAFCLLLSVFCLLPSALN